MLLPFSVLPGTVKVQQGRKCTYSLRACAVVFILSKCLLDIQCMHTCVCVYIYIYICYVYIYIYIYMPNDQVLRNHALFKKCPWVYAKQDTHAVKRVWLKIQVDPSIRDIMS
jgi:hypothetical protein